MISSSDLVRRAEAIHFAERHGYFYCVSQESVPAESRADIRLLLDFTVDGILLSSLEHSSFNPLQIDFLHGKAAWRQRHLQAAGGAGGEQLLKALGLAGSQAAQLVVVDATAGLGRDAFLIAGRAGKVLMFERHPVLACMLRDALARAAHDSTPDDNSSVKMVLHDCDFSNWSEPGEQVDVVYLDPMFDTAEQGGGRRKKGPLVKKDMQLLHVLHQCEASDAEGIKASEAALMAAAVALDPARIVVKRSRLAPFLADRKTGTQLLGKSNRFDIYPIRSLKNTGHA